MRLELSYGQVHRQLQIPSQISEDKGRNVPTSQLSIEMQLRWKKCRTVQLDQYPENQHR
ncbi:hypothetical protein D3C75_1255100 [compost metagenome]